MKVIDWYGCYAESWQGEIVPEAFAHPAKYARGLIGRIYEHCLAQGYFKPGDTIGDPFGGVALGSIHAMLNGLHWRGVELEPKFVDLGNQNIKFWNGRYGLLLKGTAVLVQGDSRQFLQHVAGIGGVVSSAPFGRNVEPPRSNDPTKGKNGRSVIGLQYADNTPGQLGNMKEGDLKGLVSSPPYVDAVDGSGEGPGARYDHKTHKGENTQKQSSQAEYGREPGNLGNMEAGELEGVVSSPPYTSDALGHKGKASEIDIAKRLHARVNENSYADNTPGQLGNDSGDTFWQAASTIVAQCYESLKPGSYAAWVCGDFVRKGERVFFGRQWLQLCEAMGFESVEWITAWKQEPGPTQKGIFGDKDLSIDRVSFFRRLANQKNPENAILNEDVIIVRKPPYSI